MVCEYIETCKYKIALEQFVEYCARMEEFNGCPCENPPHVKTPKDWRHYFRIAHHALHREDEND